MAQITFNGICSGTIEKTSTRKGTQYKITSFVEIPSLAKFEVFGDLGLTAHEDVRPYVLEGNVVSLGNVTVKSVPGAFKPKS